MSCTMVYQRFAPAVFSASAGPLVHLLCCSILRWLHQGQLEALQTSIDARAQQQERATSGHLTWQQRFDASISELHRQSHAGELPGKVYGRLCNVACVKEAGTITAVNAALQEVSNLSSMVITSHRYALSMASETLVRDATRTAVGHAAVGI